MKDKRNFNKQGKQKFIEELKHRIKQIVKQDGISNISRTLQRFKDAYTKGIIAFGIRDPEQSWKSFKGHLLEDLIMEEIKLAVESTELKLIKGSELGHHEKNLDVCLSKVKRSLVIDFGNDFGLHLPDADLVVYEPIECIPIAIISVKASLRERIAQTGYWSLKLKQSEITSPIKTLFITLDEDGELINIEPVRKGRAIAEVDIDATYVIRDDVPLSDRIKPITELKDDLMKWLRQRKS